MKPIWSGAKIVGRTFSSLQARTFANILQSTLSKDIGRNELQFRGSFPFLGKTEVGAW